MLDYEARRDMIATRAWETWTLNGLRCHAEADTAKTVDDAAAKSYRDGIDDAVWLHATLARLHGFPIGSRVQSGFGDLDSDFGTIADPPKRAFKIQHTADALWVVHEICPAEWLPVIDMIPADYEGRAADYALHALRAVTRNPPGPPWRSVDEWVAYELASGLPADRPMIEVAAIKAALRNVATLEALNAPFENIEQPRCTPPEPPTEGDHQP